MVKRIKFCEFLNYSPENKILAYLFAFKDVPFTFREVVRGAGVNTKRGYDLLHKLLKAKSIKKDKKVRHVQYYILNIKSKTIKELIKVFERLENKK